MDGLTEAAAPGGIVGFVMEYGNVVFFFAQIIYWTVLAVAAVWAVTLLKRLVDHTTGGAQKAEKVAEKAISVEEFVD